MTEEKTEKATPKKIRDAREKGQVSNSKELVSASIMVALYVVFFLFGAFLLENFMGLIVLPATYYELDFVDALAMLYEGMKSIALMIILPIVLTAVVIAIFANFIQIGPIFSVDPILPKLEKLSPIAGFKRIFALKNLMEFLKTLLKVGIVALACYFVITRNFSDILRLPQCQETCLLPFLGYLVMQIAIYSSLAFMLIAVLDIFYQRYEHAKSLRMTKDEVKREHKDMEGNPEIKSKRKGFHKEIVQGDDVEKTVKNSSVLVTNPTHLAIGLVYDGKRYKVPTVTIKGEDLVAQQLKQIASKSEVPMMENVSLARALYARVEVGDPIPRALFSQVAQVLKWVKSLERAEDVDYD